MSNLEAPAAAVPAVVEPAPKRRRRPLRWLLLLSAVAGLAWFAPQIVGRTELRQRVPGLLFPFFKGQIRLGPASLGWLSPIVIRDTVAYDPDGQVLAEIAEIRLDTPLWKLAANSQQLGVITLTGITANGRIRGDGSNLEDAGWDFWNAPATGPSPQFELQVRDSRVHIENTVTQAKSQLEGIEADLTFNGQTATRARFALRPKEAASDQVSVVFETRAASEGTLPLVVAMEADHWSLAPLEPVLTRLAPNLVARGVITASVRAEADSTAPVVKGAGRIAASQVQVAGAPGMAGDTLQLATLELGAAVDWQKGRLTVSDGKLGCDAGHVTITGGFPMDAARPVAIADLIRSIVSNDDYAITGQLDLARLAELLPQTLQIRADTRISQGTLQVQLESRERDARRQWTGRAAVAGLAAQQNGQPLTWDSPVVAEFAAHLQGADVVFDRLSCQSDFATAEGRGSLADATFDASCDLDRLARELQRFVDLSGRQLAGRANITGRIQQTDGDKIAATAQMKLQQMQIGLNREQVWAEPELTVDLRAEGPTLLGVPLAEISTARITVKAADDMAVAELTAPWRRSTANAEMAGRVGLRGDLSRWQRRIRPWLDLGAWQVAGSIQSMCEVRMVGQSVEVKQADVLLEQFYAQSAGWMVNDPQVRLKTAGTWSSKDQRWQAQSTSLVGTTFRAELTDGDVVLAGPQSPRMTGSLEYQADLGALSRWQVPAGGAEAYAAQGMLTGTGKVQTEAGVISAEWQTEIDQLALLSGPGAETGISRTPQQAAWETLWAEPKLQLNGAAKYLTAQDRLELTRAGGQVDGLIVEAHGTIDQFQTATLAKLEGQLDYDWTRLSKRLGESVTRQFQIEGAGKQAFTFQGTLSGGGMAPGQAITVPVSLSSTPPAGSPVGADWQGRAAAGWNSAKVYGLPVGAGTVSVDLVQGLCRFGLPEVPVAEGRVRAQPVVHFDQSPSLLTMGEGRVIEQVRASPELCEMWMRYIGPMLADATRVDGRFSVDLANASVPLNAMRAGDIGGAIQIHGVDVRPGPLAMRYTDLAQQIQTLIKGNSNSRVIAEDKAMIRLPEQTVPFRVINGRVHHQHMEMHIGEVILKTQGSVGFDESLEINADVPIQDDWIAGKKFLAGLKGKSVRIPIRGTVNRPQLDGQAIVELGRLVATSAAGGLLNDKLGGEADKLQQTIEDKLGRGLEKLLPRKK